MPCGIASATLACLFAGIWISDGAALALLDPPGRDLTMRLSSLIAYIALFAGIRWATCSTAPTQRGARRLLKGAALAGIVAYAAGCAIMALTGQVDAALRDEAAVAAFFLLKLIGAPLSVALVCRFSRFPYRRIARMSTLGILGAFLLKEAAGAGAALANLDEAGSFALGSALILAAACLALPAIARGDLGAPPETATALQPFSALVNRNLALGVIVASVMLGFLRSGDPAGPVGTSPTISVALATIAALACLVPRADMHDLFRGALMCTAGGFLLGPLLESLAPGGGAVLVGVGTALFEAVAWMVAVVIVRSCAQPLLAAAGVRLAIVVGHLAGAALGMGAQAWARVDANAPEAFSLVIVFAYVVMLAYLFGDPVAKLPFVSGRAGTEGTHPAASVGPAAGIASPAPAASEARLWADICSQVAREHGLTPRETDVLEQLARGRDLAYMEEKFVLSRNTVKMHIRHVYEKLGVHSKQEVIDLVEAASSQTEGNADQRSNRA